jgi:DNA polymerase-3 subunit epsilon
MQLAGGGSLSRACADYGLDVRGEAHTAHYDARATAKLLAALLQDAPALTAELSRNPPITWPNSPTSTVEPLTREVSRTREVEAPGYIQALLSRVPVDMPADEEESALVAYNALLTRVLEDRRVSEDEGRALVELATEWAIPAGEIRKANRKYVVQLAVAALADGVVTEAERRDLRQVAALLGLDSRNLGEILEIAAQELATRQSEPRAATGALGGAELVGKRVCFTGECQYRLKGEPITRATAAGLATGFGMIVAESVTKKPDVLVVADPYTQSGKARRARQYGIRIIHEPVFWSALGLEVG